MKAMTARVLVTEGHPVSRWGISRLIHEQDGLVIIGLADPDEHGLPLARHLRDRFDDLGIVVLGGDDDAVLLGAFETGVSAFVSRSAPVTEVVAAVRHAAVAASFTAAGLAAALRRQRDAAAPASTLSGAA